MNPIIYNACMLLGLVLVGVGVFLVQGIGYALVAVGLLLLVLNAFTARLVTQG